MSRTQSSSLPGGAPSCTSLSSSAMEDRFMQGTGYGEACTVTDSPGFSVREARPSMETPAGARLRSPIYNYVEREWGEWAGAEEAYSEGYRGGGGEDEWSEGQASRANGSQDEGA
jgi:hypothetical protein